MNEMYEVTVTTEVMVYDPPSTDKRITLQKGDLLEFQEDSFYSWIMLVATGEAKGEWIYLDKPVTFIKEVS